MDKLDLIYKKAFNLELQYERLLRKKYFKQAKRLKAQLDGLWDEFARTVNSSNF